MVQRRVNRLVGQTWCYTAGPLQAAPSHEVQRTEQCQPQRARGHASHQRKSLCNVTNRRRTYFRPCSVFDEDLFKQAGCLYSLEQGEFFAEMLNGENKPVSSGYRATLENLRGNVSVYEGAETSVFYLVSSFEKPKAPFRGTAP